MKRLNLLLLAVLLIATGFCELMHWDIAAYILLGSFCGGIVSEFIMPRLAKRLAKTPPEPLPVRNEETKREICERISVKTGQKIDIIEIGDIVFFAANGDYVSIYTEKGVWLKEMTMKELETMLPQERFVRVHRSYIVNILCIKAIDRYKKGQYMLTLSNKEKIKMSDNGYLILKNRLSL
ncbi:MAG: LytTR family transcriptional regulator DNA-binding domain-containing protein [Bacteroidales bacterium]|jgi:DNA-binding LytR/AlgR family response regulator|nr:LytTR family transcriptional regulator DNA-binding domain-containing protein [Bacteroidales bacterium]